MRLVLPIGTSRLQIGLFLGTNFKDHLVEGLVMDELPIIFTPDNEPYLGDPHLKVFDDSIIAAMELVRSKAEETRSHSLSNLQRAAIQIIPQGVSIALATRELIRQAYLFGALTLT